MNSSPHIRSFWHALLVCAFAISFAHAETVAAPKAGSLAARKPNIIFILTDDQGYGDLSCHGNPVLKTPNLDRLHAEGVRFTDFHVSPTCAPTRSALLTGRHEFKNGITHTILERERLTPDAVTLAQVLKTAGYTTGIFGKWHLGDEPEYWPSKRGFDEMFIHGAGGIGQTYPGSCGDAPGNTYFSPTILHNGTFEKTDGYCTDIFFGQAMRWIEATKGKQPFYAHIATNAPHAPLQVRPEDEARYTGKVPADTAKFFGMIANIDDNVGRLLAKLTEWGIERETLVVFMNDNGGTGGVKVFNAGMRGAKGSPWLGGTRASSFWRWPGTLQPRDVSQLTAHIDFFPTLAELAGASLDSKVKTQVEGLSLVPLLAPQTTNVSADAKANAVWPERTLFTHVGRWKQGESPEKMGNCSVRTPRWHLVHGGGQGKRGGGGGNSAGSNPSATTPGQWQLFDVQSDPGEQQNIAANHPEEIARLSTAYDQWWTSVLPMMVNENAKGPDVNPFKALYEKQFGKR